MGGPIGERVEWSSTGVNLGQLLSSMQTEGRKGAWRIGGPKMDDT
jgi:hypothetical protein